MNKRTRQYIGLFSAVFAYYLIHEGAHLIYALAIGAFKQINIMGLGMQIDIYEEQMTSMQLGIFCLVGAMATLVTAYILTALAHRIKEHRSSVLKACMYYITFAMLLLDPLYLSVLCGFFGGGDMNGIALLVPEYVARIGYVVLLVVNGTVFFRVILPEYKKGFSVETT